MWRRHQQRQLSIKWLRRRSIFQTRAPRPGEQADILRFNNAMGAIGGATGLPMPGVKMEQDGGFQGVFRVEGRLDSKRLDEELKKR